MNCDCHGQPAYWQRDKRCRAGGWWECRTKRLERERAIYLTDGWKKKRLYRLEKQRDRLVSELEALERA